ncbi:MAG: hypothetical protein Q4E59_06725 [Bacteroidales bacterium]|nr:hypothetical protein [Bacteroidales bacterium]
MKKIIMAALMTFAFALGSHAQSTPHAIGVHLGGSTMDLEYQYHFNNKNFLDVTAGVFDLNDGFCFQAVYNWNIKQWADWTPNFATWKFWGGVGAGLGFYDADSDDGLFVGPVGTLGFGFTVKDFPLTIGIDYRPMIALNIGDNFGLIDSGFKNFGLTMTYRF